MKKIKARYTHNPEIGELAMVKDTLPKALNFKDAQIRVVDEMAEDITFIKISTVDQRLLRKKVRKYSISATELLSSWIHEKLTQQI